MRPITGTTTSGQWRTLLVADANWDAVPPPVVVQAHAGSAWWSLGNRAGRGRRYARSPERPIRLPPSACSTADRSSSGRVRATVRTWRGAVRRGDRWRLGGNAV